PGPLRGPVATDVLAHRRRRAGPRETTGARSVARPLEQRADDPELDDAPRAAAPVVLALIELERPRAAADPARRERHAPRADHERAARARRLAEPVVLHRLAVEAVVAVDRRAGREAGEAPRRLLARAAVERRVRVERARDDGELRDGGEGRVRG